MKVKLFFKNIWGKISKFFFTLYRKSMTSKSTRNVVFTFFFFAVGFAIYTYFYWENTFNQFVGTLAGIGTAAFVGSIIHLVSLGFEDKNKVSTDFTANKKIYTNENYIQKITFEDGSIYKFLYSGESKIINKLNIIDNKDIMYTPTDIMVNNYTKLFSAHRGSFKKNFFTVKIDEMELSNNELNIKSSRSTYFSHLISNRVIDFPFEKSLTLRKIYEPGPKLTSLSQSKLSNHLGIIGLIKTSDNYFLVNRRSKTGSTSKDFLVAPVSLPLFGDYESNVTEEYIKNTIINRVNSQIDCSEDKTDVVDKIVFTGYGRDIYEGGKPHIFLLVEINITKDEYINRLNKTRKNKKSIDYDSRTFAIKKDGLGFHKDYLVINHHTLKSTIKSYIMSAETNLYMCLKTLFDLDLFK